MRQCQILGCLDLAWIPQLTNYIVTLLTVGLLSLTGCKGSTEPGGTTRTASRLAFSVQPTNAVSATPLSPAVQVTIEDAQGNTVTGATISVTLAIGTNPGGGTLSGTTTVAAVSGVATFSTLSIDKAGTGYTLTATATGLTGTSSATFNVTAGAVPIVTVSNWTSLGPHHINGQAGAVESGKLQALAIFTNNPSIMYAGGGLGSGNEGPLTEAGAFKTTDGGAHWTAINSGLVDPIVNALWVDQTNSNVVVAGTENSGIFKSSDGGQSWTLTGNFGATLGAASDFVSANGKLLAATAVGVAQSSDAGTTWSVILTTVSPVRALAAGGGALIAGLENGTIMMQATPSASWQTALTNAGRTVWSIAIDQSSPTTAYAVLGNAPVTFVGTSSGGLAWAVIPAPCAPNAVLMPNASHTLYVACGQAGLYSTTNGGQAYAQIPGARWDDRRIFWLPGQPIIVLGSDQGLHQTSDSGNTWVNLSSTVHSSILTALAVHGSTILTAVQDFSPIMSFDGGTTWQQPVWTSANPPIGEDGQVLINPGNQSYCYAYTTSGYQYSTDGCRTFQFVAAAALGGNTYVQPGGTDIVAVDPSTPSTVYAASQAGVFKSIDWGVTMNPTNWPFNQPFAVAVDPSDSRTVYVGTASGALYRSQDGGATWAPLSLAGAAGYPTTIAVNPLNPLVVLVGLSQGPTSGGGVLRSTDRGNTFRLVNLGLSTVRPHNQGCCGVDMLSLRFNANGIVALATSTGIYVSADLGDHWQDVTANSVPNYFSDVTWDAGSLYAATRGAGVLRAAVTVVPGVVAHARSASHSLVVAHHGDLAPPR